MKFVAAGGPWASNHGTTCVDALPGRSIMAPAMSNAKASPCKVISGCTRRCTSGNDLRRVGPQSKLNRRGETEAGNAGKQPCQELGRWAHRADEVGSVRPPAPRFLPGFKPLYPSSLTSSDDRPLYQYQSEFPAGFQLAIMFTKIIGSWRRHRRAPFYPAAVRGFERRNC